MARTKGARDKQPRKRIDRDRSGRFLKSSVSGQTEPPAAQQTPDVQAVETPSPEFDRAVAGVLGQDLPPGGTIPQGMPSGATTTSPPAASDTDVVLGIDAWEAIIEAPFRSLAIFTGIEAFAALGRARAKMLARPSYPLYRHYVTEWITENPDDPLFVAKAETLAVAATVAQELWMIWTVERAKRVAAAREQAMRAVAEPSPN